MSSPVFPDDWRRINVALCHDWLTGMRGGERVLELLCRGFESAPIYTLLRAPGAVSGPINAHRVVTSWLQRLPGIERHYRWLLPLYPAAVRALRLPPVDLVLSTSHCVAKSVRVPAGARHLCYCCTPMRYAWLFRSAYFRGRPLATAVAPVLAALRAWDRRTAAGVDRFVAVSRNVRKRIRTFYGRDADVVYPPVDVEFFRPGHSPFAGGGYDLVVSALVPYKRIDLAIDAYNRLGYPLKIAGAGAERRRLAARAAGNIEFLGRQPDRTILDLYRGCRLLVFPGEEDFGIVPLEAQACGKPVVAFGRGGALETVMDGVTGVFFTEQSESALIEAVQRGAARAWDGEAIRAHAGSFGPARFIAGLDRSLNACLAGSGSAAGGRADGFFRAERS